MRQPEQPSGTVTFLFSDIEGSTRLLGELGAERYALALDQHRALLREAFERAHGYEVNCEGDEFLIAFQSATDAVAAAEEAQQALAAHAWPEGRELRVRIGVHTGNPLLAPPKYVGLDVHRAARIMTAAHGGQVLVSATTAERLVPQDHSLRDLGEHRFKDLAAAEHVYQVGGAEFPPIRSLYRSNLPVPATSFLGRERELAELVELLSGADVSLVTLTGPGGTGKTRLALQAAAEVSERFPAGVWWVALAPLRDPALALSSIAQMLEMQEEPGRELLETLSEQLHDKRLLVLLDNAEHLLPELASELAGLRSALPSLALLVTSRERLQLAGEEVWPVPSLAQPEGIELFLTRARSLGVPLDDGQAVAELCERLDNLPLAIELAAARTVVFSPEQLLERLGQRLDLFRGGRDVDARQQTLRGALEWSHDLLSDGEQQLFARLSPFVGGCAYEAAERVSSADPETLQSLIDKSLLRRRDSEHGPRYWMLETIREYAVEQLAESGQAAEILEAHADWCLLLAERMTDARGTPDEAQLLLAVEAEHDNIRAAMDWALGASRFEYASDLAIALSPLWTVAGHFREGRETLAAAAASEARPDRLSRVLLLLAVTELRLGYVDDGRRHVEESLPAARAEGGEHYSWALNMLGNLELQSGDLESACAAFEESAAVARAAGDRYRVAVALGNLGATLGGLGRFDDSIPPLEESAELTRAAGDRIGLGFSLGSLGLTYLKASRPSEAADPLRQALELGREMGYPELNLYCFIGLAGVAQADGDLETSAVLAGAADAVRQSLGLDTSDEQELYDRIVADLARELGPERFDALFGQGRGQEVDQTLAMVLE